MTLSFDLLIEIYTFLAVLWIGRLALIRADTYLNVHRRLATGPGPDKGSSTSTVLKSETVRNPFLRWVQSATSLNDPENRGRLRRELALAGFDSPIAPSVYVLTRFVLAIGLPFILMFSQTMSAKPLTGINLVAAALLLCGLGLVAPRSILDNRVRNRKEQLEHEFPDALDLLVVCVGAGLGIEAAVIRVATESRDSHPRISGEFQRLASELSAGRSRVDAFRAMAERTDVPVIRSFVALLIQTDALGVSIAQTLRTYSVEMREHRFLTAEEKAMRIPVLMTIPLVVCILPVIVMTALLPLILDVHRTLLPALKGIGHH